MGSVHQDASGLKHIPLLTPCYIFMWANIPDQNIHVGDVLFSNHHPYSSSDISITWVTSLASSLHHTLVASQYMTPYFLFSLGSATLSSIACVEERSVTSSMLGCSLAFIAAIFFPETERDESSETLSQSASVDEIRNGRPFI